MNLFQTGDFILNSGIASNFKIECDALTPEDWRTLAAMIVVRTGKFSGVVGVTRGGPKLAIPLRTWATGESRHPRLVVDDVWTTGASILKLMKPGDIGWVAFANHPIRERYPVRALFTLDAPPYWDEMP